MTAEAPRLSRDGVHQGDQLYDRRLDFLLSNYRENVHTFFANVNVNSEAIDYYLRNPEIDPNIQDIIVTLVMAEDRYLQDWAEVRSIFPEELRSQGIEHESTYSAGTDMFYFRACMDVKNAIEWILTTELTADEYQVTIDTLVSYAEYLDSDIAVGISELVDKKNRSCDEEGRIACMSLNKYVKWYNIGEVL